MYTIIETKNKRGPFALVVLPDRLDREDFLSTKASAIAWSGWYSRKWGKTPGGFGFPNREMAEQWAEANIGGEEAAPPRDENNLPPHDGGTGGDLDDLLDDIYPASVMESVAPSGPLLTGDTRKAERFEGLADKMQDSIDEKRAPLSQNWTPRRGRIKDGQLRDADRLEQTQRALRAMAAALRAGTLHPSLESLSSRKAVHEALHDFISDRAPDYVTRVTMRVALTDLVTAHRDEATAEADAEREAAEELRKLEDSQRVRNVPGFFPSPPAVVEAVAAELNLDGEALDILEPSAGLGHLAEPLREHVREHGGSLVCVERDHTLAEILDRKGYSSEDARGSAPGSLRVVVP